MEKVLLIEAKTVGGVAPIKVLDFDTKEDKLGFFYEHVDCETIDIVSAYGIKDSQVLKGVSLVVDDEGLFKEEVTVNPIGSLLYGLLDHGQPLVGNVLVCKDIYTDDGIESGGFTDEEILELQLVINKLVAENNKRAEESRAKKAE